MTLAQLVRRVRLRAHKPVGRDWHCRICRERWPCAKTFLLIRSGMTNPPAPTS